MSVSNEAVQFLGFYAALCLLCGAVALIDIRHGIIPDALNLAIAGLGLAQALSADGVQAAIMAATEGVATGAIFWLLRRLYFMLRSIDGLGLGDVKLLAAAAIWIGITGVPTLILIAALAALAVVAGLQLAGNRMSRRTALPFGPFLALGLLLTLLAQRWFL